MDSPFLADLETALNTAPASIHENDLLEDLEGWDSLGVLAVISMVLDPGSSATVAAKEVPSMAAVWTFSRSFTSTVDFSPTSPFTSTVGFPVLLLSEGALTVSFGAV